MANNKKTAVIKSNLYPMVEKSMKENIKEFDKCIAKFFNDRHEELFRTMPLDRIYYRDQDREELFNALKITDDQIQNVIRNTYYGDITAFNPRAAKDSVTVLMLTVIRYFYKVSDKKRLQLSMLYLAFSGKFYPSIHFAIFPKVTPKDYVMEYVLNNMMDNKFDLKSAGSVFGAILRKTQVWFNTYKGKFNSYGDDDAVYLIQQLHGRIKTFMVNIGNKYYKAYENKDYIVYNSDSENTDVPEEYHLANNDSFEASKAIGKTMTYIARTSVNYAICKLAVATNKYVKTEEIKAIMESIFSDKDNLPDVKFVISTMVYSYFSDPKNTVKSVVSSDFIKYSITARPNSSNKSYEEMKEIIEKWLSTGSAAYRRRYKRVATRLAYNKAVLTYLAMTIYTANK